MNRITVARALPSVMLVFVLPADAHHNSNTIYDFSKSITIEGIVTEYQFVHPHARIYLDVEDENGDIQEWMAEGANAVALRHRGWTGDEVRPGDRITVIGAPSRNGSPRIEWSAITLPDGTSLGGGNGFPKERQELLERLEQERRNRRASN